MDMERARQGREVVSIINMPLGPEKDVLILFLSPKKGHAGRAAGKNQIRISLGCKGLRKYGKYGGEELGILFALADRIDRALARIPPTFP